MEEVLCRDSTVSEQVDAIHQLIADKTEEHEDDDFLPTQDSERQLALMFLEVAVVNNDDKTCIPEITEIAMCIAQAIFRTSVLRNHQNRDEILPEIIEALRIAYEKENIELCADSIKFLANQALLLIEDEYMQQCEREVELEKNPNAAEEV